MTLFLSITAYATSKGSDHVHLGSFIRAYAAHKHRVYDQRAVQCSRESF